MEQDFQENRHREQLDRYDERHRFWQDKALSQLGNVTSVLLVISLGFTTYLIEKNDLDIVVVNLFIPRNFIFFIALIFSFLSIISGLACVLSRLYDLRLTRHAIWIRKKSYEKYHTKLPDNHINLKSYNVIKGVENFISTIIIRSYYIDDDDIQEFENLEKKFKKLRKRILYLGRFSWNALMGQVITITIGFILIVAFLMMQKECLCPPTCL